MDNGNHQNGISADMQKELVIQQKKIEFLEHELARMQQENSKLNASISGAALEIEKLKNSRAARLMKFFLALRHPQKFGASNVFSLLWKKLIKRSSLNDTWHIASGISNALVQHSRQDKKFFPMYERRQDFAGTVFIFAAVPCDDIGGGQRSAQIARSLLERMYKVHYISKFPKVENHIPQSAEFSSPQFSHHLLENCDIAELFADAPADSRVIFEMPHPDFVPALEAARQRGFYTTYELIDPWHTELGKGWYLTDTEQLFIDSCTVVTATAKTLCRSIEKRGRMDVLYLPNAADNSRFNADSKPAKPADFPCRFKKVIIYFGSLYGTWFDWQTLAFAAKENPEHGFLLIGDAPENAPAMPENVIVAGVRDNSCLAGYLAWSDAAMIPFIPSELVDAVSPVKAFEYIFAGKAVITLAMPELDNFPGVYQAQSKEEFARLCSLEDVAAPAADVREKFVSRNTWHSRVDELLAPQKNSTSCSIITLIHNNAGIIRRYLDTLLYHTEKFSNIEIIVVDNASTDGGSLIVEQEFPQVKLVRNPENGCASGRNLGVANSTGERLIFFDSDQYFSSSAWLTDCDLLCRLHPEVGAFAWGAGWFLTDSLGGPGVDDFPMRAVDSAEYRACGFRTDIHYLATCGLCIDRKLFEDIGSFDTAYDPTIFEDTDLSMKILEAGRKIAYRNFPGVMHQPHQTTAADKNSPLYRKLWQRNSDHFKKRHKDMLSRIQ